MEVLGGRCYVSFDLWTRVTQPILWNPDSQWEKSTGTGVDLLLLFHSDPNEGSLSTPLQVRSSPLKRIFLWFPPTFHGPTKSISIPFIHLLKEFLYFYVSLLFTCSKSYGDMPLVNPLLNLPQEPKPTSTTPFRRNYPTQPSQGS